MLLLGAIIQDGGIEVRSVAKYYLFSEVVQYICSRV